MADPKVKLYNFEGKEVGSIDLDSSIFGVKIKPTVVQQMAVAQAHNSRKIVAHTKDRSEVRGGGKKPWSQKGTGRARHGSSRSPLWSGGGITFGPNAERNYAVKINKKQKQVAMRMVLTDKVMSENLVALESYDLKEAKTKSLNQALQKLPVKNQSVLIVTKPADKNIILAAQNLPKVSTISYGSLNIVDLLKYKYLLVSKELINKIQEHYS